LTTPIEVDETNVPVYVNYNAVPSTVEVHSSYLLRVSNGVLLKPAGTTSYGNGTYILFPQEQDSMQAVLKDGVATVSGYAARNIYPDFGEPEISCDVRVFCQGTTQPTFEGQP
jgi:hypothetical protein